jgi:hypothetical protein
VAWKPLGAAFAQGAFTSLASGAFTNFSCVKSGATYFVNSKLIIYTLSIMFDFAIVTHLKLE